MRSYARRDLLRNPRRTFVSVGAVALGVGLFSGVLFFVDGSAATMTKRAIAPLALDMQRVLRSPLGRRLSLREQVSGRGALTPGQEVRVALTIANDGADAANEVVVNDEAPRPLTYVHGTTTIDDRAIRDVAGQSPLAQGLARTGLNIGTVAPGTTVTLTYVARATREVPAVEALPLRGTISSREDVAPAAANSNEQLTLEELTAEMTRIPGVAAADGLSFVDLPAGSLHARGRTVPDIVRVFAFDRRYRAHYPSIRVAAGSIAPGAALLSAEASRALAANPGATIAVDLPGDATPLSVAVSGVADLGRAKPLFYSRKSSKFEDFLYVPAAVIVSPAIFDDTVIPAFRAASAARGSVIRSEPVREVDVLVDRSRLHTDPARALAQTRSIAASIESIAPGQDHLIDNISNTLQVARDDAAVGKRMFVFLGLPAVVLAAVLAAFAGSIYAGAQRREQATLRMHGAHRRVLLRVLACKALALAIVGAVFGTALGLLSVMVILGRDTLFDASPGDLAASALVAVGMGTLTTALALYVPSRRSLARDVTEERREIAAHPEPAWRRRRLDLVLVAVAVLAEGIALRAGVFDAPVTSVSAGESVSLPSPLLLAPMVAWFGGILLSVRVLAWIMSRLPVPTAPRFGPVIRGTLVRSLKRRRRELTNGITGVGLVVAFGVSLAMFSATYDAAKADDARFAVGSDLRVTPSVLSAESHPADLVSKLRVAGVRAVTPLVFKLENSVLIGRFDQDRRDLAAIDAEGFSRAATLSDSFFVDQPAAAAIARLRADPRGLLVDAQTVDNLSVEAGDTVRVLLARGTKHQTLAALHVVGVFERFPGFPQGVNLVMNLALYQKATGLRDVDFFVAQTTDHGHAGLARAVGALRSGPGADDPINIDTTETALNKDQSSLTALNVNGLVDLDSLYTLLMSAAVMAIFVFGLMLQRRREYVTLRALGMQTRELRGLVLAEAALVAVGGLVAGIVVGTGMAFLFIHILRPLFILDPGLAFATPHIARLAAVAMAATLASALIATAILRRLEPSELLREA